jgi:hypothetical protein
MENYDFAICVTNFSFVLIKIFQLHDLAIVAIDAVQKSYDEASLGLTHGDYDLY